jgi:hypothetical protein
MRYADCIRVFLRRVLSERYPTSGAIAIDTIAFMDTIIEVKSWVCDGLALRRPSRISGRMGSMKLNTK